jgi:hypothetical protein
MRSSRRFGLETLEPRSLLHAGPWQEVTQALLSSHAAVAPAIVAKAAAVSAVTDDAYENNDTFGTAANLGTLTAVKTASNLVMNDAADWYKFTMNATGASSDYVKLAFTHAQGDLDLELYNSAGRLLARSQGVTNTETLSLQSRAAGTYYVRAYGYRGVHNPNYTLTIDPAAFAAPAPAPAPTPTPAPAPSTGAFDIQLNFQGLTTTEQAIFDRAAARWEQVIVGDLPNATYNGRVVDDLLIDASATAIDGVGGTLGQAGPDRFRTGTLFPYHGSMQFDTADLASMERNGSLLSVIEHEIGHILGIGTLWDDRGLLTGAGTSNPRFTGARATAEYNAIFGVHESGVPVENTGGSGTRDAHWRESVLSSELMTGWAGPGTALPLSRITVASLADLGYQVDISKADAYSRPGSAPLQSTSSLSGVAAFESAVQRERRATDHVMTLWG